MFASVTFNNVKYSEQYQQLNAKCKIYIALLKNPQKVLDFAHGIVVTIIASCQRFIPHNNSSYNQVGIAISEKIVQLGAIINRKRAIYGITIGTLKARIVSPIKIKLPHVQKILIAPNKYQ